MAEAARAAQAVSTPLRQLAGNQERMLEAAVRRIEYVQRLTDHYIANGIAPMADTAV